jgi:lipopolysaccharide transport system permease protein
MFDKQLILGPWKYRNFILNTVKNDFRTRFIRSKFGFAWMILNPLANVLILSFVLSSVLSAKLPGVNNKYAYSIYLMAGTLGWSIFSDTLMKCLNIFLENGNVMKKILFPKICLPIIAILIVLINNVLLFIAMIMVFFFLGHHINIFYFYFPIIVLITVFLGSGIGLILGLINVFIRDISQIVPIILQFIFWLTPIVYMPVVIPEKFKELLHLNPVYGLIISYQKIILFEEPPSFDILLYPIILSISLLVIFYIMFVRANSEMVDVL